MNEPANEVIQAEIHGKGYPAQLEYATLNCYMIISVDYDLTNFIANRKKKTYREACFRFSHVRIYQPEESRSIIVYCVILLLLYIPSFLLTEPLPVPFDFWPYVCAPEFHYCFYLDRLHNKAGGVIIMIIMYPLSIRPFYYGDMKACHFGIEKVAIRRTRSKF